MGAKMLGEFGSWDRRVTKVMAGHPTASVQAVLGRVQECSVLNEHIRVLSIV